MKKNRWNIICALLVGLNVAAIDNLINSKEQITESTLESRNDEIKEERIIKEEELLEEEPFFYIEEESDVSWYKYKGDEFDYVDKETFQKLKKIYEDIDFSGEFKKVDDEVYNEYKHHYAKLLNGEAKITGEDGEEQDLEYYGYDMENLVSASLYYFDMDEDGLPELCLKGRGIYVIKYFPDTDQYCIWWKGSFSGTKIAGSRKIRQTGLTKLDVYYLFYQMKGNGDVEFSVECRIEAEEYSGELFYFVSLPYYEDESKEPEIQKEIKEQMNLDTFEDGYVSFRVTEKQYEEIEQMCYKTIELSGEETVKLSYFLPEKENMYSSYDEFPDDMVYADQQAFEMLENLYEKIDFYREFKKGNPGIYDKYKEKYAELLSGRKGFKDEDGNDFDSLEGYIDTYSNSSKKYSLEEYLRKKSTRLYYFDMDEDNLPELCIEGIYGIYIFKYNPDIDKFNIWWENWPEYNILGSKKIRYTQDYYNQYLELDEKGDVVFCVDFGVREPEEGTELIYMVSMPDYMDETKNEQIPDHIKNQSYIVVEYNKKQYFVRVTKKQYEKLTKDFFEAEASALKEAVPLSYFFPEQ